MDSICSFTGSLHPIMLNKANLNPVKSSVLAMASKRTQRKKLPKNLLNPRQTKDPPEFGVNLFLKNPCNLRTDSLHKDDEEEEEEEEKEENRDDSGDDELEDVVWEEEELEALSSLFQGRIPQKPGKLKVRERPLPLPIPHKLRPLGLPTVKKHVKLASPALAASRAPVSNHVYKNPRFLIGLAKQISTLSSEEDVSMVLNKCRRFLRKGSLSLTIKELGQMGLPDRALQTFCWAQKQPGLFPDDRILSSVIEILAKNHEFKVPLNLAEFVDVSSRSVLEAMVSGFIKGGRLNVAWNLLKVAKRKKRMLDANVYVKLILELGKNPDKQLLVSTLLKDLSDREDLNLSQQDCTTIMKVCIKVGNFELVEGLFQWYKQSGRDPTIVMYTTLIHSHDSEKRYREALALVWEMESSDFLFDLPAYRVVIKLFVALNDLSRASRYFSKLKEAGLSPSYDIYREMIRIYLAEGLLAKCKEVCKEAEMAGFKIERQLLSQLSPIT
ncbi:pentatricopeptide repeat-containing protein At2g01860-like [Rutidosis leptorrhynchoides]|uniref:pentatricopeptide repeat-containing protein At2g01860-like n=1 Tax=Rutidosis leptorrhynchoides TaxID=125765 RepID=UPI003A99B55B